LAGGSLLAATLDGYQAIQAPRIFFLVGTYFIVKDKSMLAIAKCCHLRVYVPTRKIQIWEMDLLSLPDSTTTLIQQPKYS